MIVVDPNECRKSLSKARSKSKRSVLIPMIVASSGLEQRKLGLAIKIVAGHGRTIVEVVVSNSVEVGVKLFSLALLCGDVPKDKRPHAMPLLRIIHGAPPPPQHNHPPRQDHTLVGPAPIIDVHVIIKFKTVIACQKRGGTTHPTSR